MNPMPREINSDVDIAVLQVQVENIDTRLDDIKHDILELKQQIDRSASETRELIREVKSSADTSHKDMNRKITALEKWRWMLMGAGIILGAMGFNTIKALLH
jgi:hypothetical protein